MLRVFFFVIPLLLLSGGTALAGGEVGVDLLTGQPTLRLNVEKPLGQLWTVYGDLRVDSDRLQGRIQIGYHMHYPLADVAEFVLTPKVGADYIRSFHDREQAGDSQTATSGGYWTPSFGIRAELIPLGERWFALYAEANLALPTGEISGELEGTAGARLFNFGPLTGFIEYRGRLDLKTKNYEEAQIAGLDLSYNF